MLPHPSHTPEILFAVRLHGAIGYVTLNDMLTGRHGTIHAERDRRPASSAECDGARRTAPMPWLRSRP
jgi:hypothetical protein